MSVVSGVCQTLSVAYKVSSLGLLLVRRMGSVSEMLTAVPLHKRPDLLEACADLINEEWKRSRTSRIHSLEKSSDNFPTCLVLIRTLRPAEETAEGKTAKSQCQLLGHARLSRVVGQPNSLLVETVVVAKAFRGKGYGRKLMEAVEKYAKAHGYQCLYLTTHDKQHFYAHLGYSLSKPVQCIGFLGPLIPMTFLEKFCAPQHEMELPSGIGKLSENASLRTRSGSSLSPSQCVASFSSSFCAIASPLGPQPCSYHSGVAFVPPHPPLSPSDGCCNPSGPLPSLPPAPPPLPVPPAKGFLLGQPNSSKPASFKPQGNTVEELMLLEPPYRDVKGKPIFWMKKVI